MYALYSLLTVAGMVLLSPYFLIRGLIDGKYLGHVRERLGYDLDPRGFRRRSAGCLSTRETTEGETSG